MLTLENMQHRWPHGDQHIPGLIEGIVKASNAVFAKYGVTTHVMIAHVMAQFSTECGQGLEMVENLNYSAEGLLKTFPTHFTIDMAARTAHNQQMIGQIAYGGRMGNDPPPSLDGYTYRGAGLSQVTGKAGVTALQAFLVKNGADFDIVQTPELIIDPDYALEVGVADLAQLGCLPFAAADDIVNVTKHLNGGLNGLPDRRLQLAAWKAELGVSAVVALASRPTAPAAAKPNHPPARSPPKLACSSSRNPCRSLPPPSGLHAPARRLA